VWRRTRSNLIAKVKTRTEVIDREERGLDEGRKIVKYVHMQKATRDVFKKKGEVKPGKIVKLLDPQEKKKEWIGYVSLNPKALDQMPIKSDG